MALVELNMILTERSSYIYDETEVPQQPVEPVETDGEDDGIGQVESLAEARAARSTEPTTPTSVNPVHVRNFYRRKRRTDGTVPVGTRINFANGTGMAVSETYDEVKAKLSA
jgi:hypothetical protein